MGKGPFGETGQVLAMVAGRERGAKSVVGLRGARSVVAMRGAERKQGCRPLFNKWLILAWRDLRRGVVGEGNGGGFWDRVLVTGNGCVFYPMYGERERFLVGLGRRKDFGMELF